MNNLPPDTGRSSLYTRLTPELRQDLDRAIINHDPPSLTACFHRHALDRHGVSLTAFKAYARRLRALHQRDYLAAIGDLAAEPVLENLPALIHHLVADAIVSDNVCARDLYRMLRCAAQAIRNMRDLRDLNPVGAVSPPQAPGPKPQAAGPKSQEHSAPLPVQASTPAREK